MNDIITYKIPSTLQQGFETATKYQHDPKRKKDYINDAPYLLYTNKKIIIDKIFDAISSDDMNKYTVEVIVKHEGFNFDNDKYYTLMTMRGSSDEHIPNLLSRHFNICTVKMWRGKSEYDPPTYHVYDSTSELLSAVSILQDLTPEFDNCIKVTNKTYVTAASVESSLSASGITDPAILEELRKKMLDVNNQEKLTIEILHPYFLGWLQCRGRRETDRVDGLPWVFERIKGKLTPTLTMRVDELRELFDKWVNTEKVRDKFCQYGYGKDE
jgi:hypothetical protein